MQTYGGTFYKRWKVIQYLGTTACKGDKKFSGLFDSENTKSFSELHTGVKGFFDGKQLFLWLELMQSLHIFRRHLLCPPRKRQNHSHKPVFCPMIPSCHPEPTFLGWEHLKTQKFVSWQWSQRPLSCQHLHEGTVWDVKPPAGLWSRYKRVESRREPGRPILGDPDSLDHGTPGHVWKLGLQAKYFARVMQQR